MPSKPTKKTPQKAKATPSAAKKSSPLSVIPFSPLSPNVCGTEYPGNFNSMEKVMNSAKSQYEKISCDANTMGRQGIEAITKSTSQFTKGMECVVKTVVSLAQESASRQSEGWKNLLSAKTMTEMAEAQNKLAQQSMEDAMSAATKICEMSIKICTEAFEPLNDQMTKAAKKASETFAA